jgi:hypothetical protein
MNVFDYYAIQRPVVSLIYRHWLTKRIHHFF